MALKVTVTEKDEGVFYISPVGQIDSETYRELSQKMAPLLKKSTKVLLLNMAGVDYITSMGIGVIMNAKKTIDDLGGTFIMAELQPQVRTVFDIIKVLPKMSIFENMEEADRYFTAIQRRVIEKGKGEKPKA